MGYNTVSTREAGQAEMTVKEMRETLENYPDDLDIVVVQNGRDEDRKFEVAFVGTYSNDTEFLQIEMSNHGEVIE